MKRWLAIPALAVLVAGCGEETPTVAEQRADRSARYNREMARLSAELQVRNARIEELHGQLRQLSARLSKSESTNKQLRLRLEAVGAAPMERDRFRKLSEERALEINRLQDRIRALHARLSRATHSPASQPAETAGGD